MNDNKLYVFFGALIEYSLNPLYLYMKDQGYNCVEITPRSCTNMRETLQNLPANEYIFITSAHVFLDETYPIFNNSPKYICALEAIDILKPVKVVYYPHDLAMLVHEFDKPWLNSIFDLILFPIEGFTHLSCHGKPIYNVGWIKKEKKTGQGTRFKVGHGIGDWLYYKEKEPRYIYNVFQKVWKQGVIVKNASFRGDKKLKAIWRKKNINFIEGETSIFELIDSCEIMLTNSLTSVNIESALSGRFTINMLDGIFDKKEHKECFRGIPNLKIKTIAGTAKLLKTYFQGDFIPPQGEDLLKPFDFKQAVELITA
jgi:hypothetical protein